VSEVIDQWHPDVVADFRELPQDVQAAYLEPIEVIKPDPKLGEHLDRRASTGELSVHRKVRFGAKPLGSLASDIARSTSGARATDQGRPGCLPCSCRRACPSGQPVARTVKLGTVVITVKGV